MKTAIWLSRHVPTPEQLEEITSMQYVLIIDEGRVLGAMELVEDADVKKLISELQNLVRKVRAEAIFGVWSTPVLEVLNNMKNESNLIPCYGAWNVLRSVEGEKPTFKHKKWCCIGYFSK